MKLSRTVTYALKATLLLAQNASSAPVPCSRLASEGGMPERFLLQILRSLVTHGILKSTRGVDGGYVLLKEAGQVSLLDIIEAMEGPLTNDVLVGEWLPFVSRTKLSNVLAQVTESTQEILASVSIADLLVSSEDLPTCQPAVEDATVSRIDQPAKVAPAAVSPPIVISNQDVIGPPNQVPTIDANSGTGV